MPPKRKRVGDDNSQPQKKQAGDAPTGTSPFQLTELTEAIIDHLRWKDLPSAILVCSKWLNIIKTKQRDYEFKYMKEYGGHSAYSYDTILEDPEREEDTEFMELTWKEKYEKCTADVARMKGQKRRIGDDPKQMLTVWALENGHHAFLKKLIQEGNFSNLEYYQRNIIEIIQERKDNKLLKIIMTDLPEEQRDELDIFTILTQAVSNNDIVTAKKLFKYGYECDEEVGRSCVVSAVLAKNHEMMKVLSDNKAAYYQEDLQDSIEQLGWNDIIFTSKI